MIKNLSPRLSVIAEMIEGGAVADIGTDHGYLAVYLAESGKAKRVFACDINEKPLENARQNTAESFAANIIELRLGNGLAAVSPGEIDTAVIAGMGAEVIIGILSAAEWIKSDKYTLVLQPMTSPELLRKYLAGSGFSIECERAVCDNGRLYSVMRVKYSAQTAESGSAFAYIGALKPERELDRRYIEKQYTRFKRCADSLQGTCHTAEYEEYKGIAEAIHKVLGE